MLFHPERSEPSPPRWFYVPGPMGRGFFSAAGFPAAVFVLLLFGSLITGCANPDVDAYRGRQPALDPEQFFSGFLTAHGIVKNFRGVATRHFNADITGCWQDGVGVLNEQFLFDNGERQTRKWILRPSGEQTFFATAGDVVGEGMAEWQGNALFLDYTLRVTLDDGPIDLRIDDRMYRVSENVLINESGMSKFGLGVGEIVLTIIRHPNQVADCP